MSAEPLWRGKTESDIGATPGESWLPGTYVNVPPGSEVEVWPAGDRVIYHAERVSEEGHWEITQEVWPAGDRTSPTWEQVADVLATGLTCKPAFTTAGIIQVSAGLLSLRARPRAGRYGQPTP